MENTMIFQSNTSLLKDTKVFQRAVYLVLGLGMIITAMANPPVTTTWLAIVNFLGIVLVSMAILGNHVIPQLKGGNLAREPRLVTSSLELAVGLGVAVTAIAYPPMSTTWVALAHLASIAIVTKTIISFDFMLSSEAGTESTESEIPTTETYEHEQHWPKAA